MTIIAGSRVRFFADYVDGSTIRWTATVVKVVDGIAFVRHPSRARNFAFSPVRTPGLYKYRVEQLTPREDK
jgi:hypothetical protein